MLIHLGLFLFMDIIPLNKLISRLRTDLKLADKYREQCCHDGYPEPCPETNRKNQRKMSILHYLEEYKKLLNK